VRGNFGQMTASVAQIVVVCRTSAELLVVRAGAILDMREFSLENAAA